MINKDTIEKIIEIAQIEEVISGFIKLKKRGVNYIGICPFHDEKTPSFSVSPTKGIYKCFGCGKGGNSISFIMEHEHYSYPEALKYLAEKYNIEIEEKELTPEESIKANDRDSLYIITSFANKFFQDSLWNTKEGEDIAISYFKERGFSNNIIKTFELGYNLDKKDAVTKHALNASYQKKYLIDSGVSINTKNNYPLDRFKGRVIFPIHSFSGRILGFGGRSLRAASKAKYINSPESLIYSKSNILYGLYFAKHHIAKHHNCYIVEGYTDVISFYQLGVKNVVASSGTALTNQQIKLIARFTKNITILFDGDIAGIKASFRSIDMILTQGMNVRVVLFPNGEDPDSYAQKCNQEELLGFLKKNTKDFITFKIEVLTKESLNTPSQRIVMIKDIASSIACIPDNISRSEYIKDCSHFLNVNELELSEEVSSQKNQKKDYKNNVQKNDAPEHKIKDEKQQKEEKEILRLLLNYGNTPLKINNKKSNIASFIIFELESDDIPFQNKDYGYLLKEISTQIKKYGEINLMFFTAHQNDVIRGLTVDLVSKKHDLSENWKSKHKIFTDSESNKVKKSVENSIYNLKLKHLDEKLIKLQISLKKTPEEALHLTNLYAKLLQIRKKIAEKLGKIIG